MNREIRWRPARASIPTVAVVSGFAVYLVHAIVAAPPLVDGAKYWLPLALLMAHAFGGIAAAIAIAQMYPTIGQRSWRSVATASGALASLATVAAACTKSWRSEVAAFLLGVAAIALIFARARPHLHAHRTTWTRLAWLCGFLVLVAAFDLRLDASFRSYAEPAHPFHRTVTLAEIYFIELCLAAAMLATAPRATAVVGVILLATPHALRPFFREYWPAWQWMRPAAGILLACSMVQRRYGGS
jgi:hypothetical protein